MPRYEIRYRDFWLTALINITAALILPAVMWLFGNPQPHELWLQFKYGTVYSWCIGLPAYFIGQKVGLPFAGLRPGFRILAYVTVAIIVVVGGAVAANLIFLAAGWTNPEQFHSSLIFGLKVSFAITFTLGTLVTVIETLHYRLTFATRELAARQLAEERATKLAMEAQLSSLESRIHPHFLFNTLNSITSLIREDPARAERTVERLAALLRYSLDVNARSLVPLDQELQIVRSYLEIEKTRLGDRLHYTIDVPREMLDLEVPPLAVQTLAENSIKHAIATRREGGDLLVRGGLEEGHMILEVSDDGPGFDLRSLKASHGLENLQDRLAALFQDSARIELARRDGRMRVLIKLPLRKVPA